MPEVQRPSVDVEAPDGRRIVLHPVIRLSALPKISPAGLALVVVLSLIWLLTSCYRLNHTDLWTHLNFGRWIIEHGTLPTTDPFRDFVSTLPVVLQDWLAQVLGYGWYELFGAEGLVLAHALLVTISCGVLVAACRQRQTPLSFAVAAAATAYVLGSPVIGTIRPQLFGMLAFTLTLLGVSRLTRHRDPIFWLPLVFAGWANTHGSFPLGLAVLGACAVGCSIERWLGTDRGHHQSSDQATSCPAPIWLPWATLGLSAAATCLNPYGPGLLLYVVQFQDISMLEDISEWRPMTLGTLSGGLFAASLIVSAVLLRLSPRRLTLADVLTALGLAVLAVSSMRMLTWWALAWPWIAAPHAAAVWSVWRAKYEKAEEPPLGASPDDEASDDPAPFRTLLGVAVVFLALMWSPPMHAIVGDSRSEASVLGRGTPLKVTEWFVEQQITARVFCPMDWGSYFIWKTEEAVSPLVHTHIPLTPPEVWADYLQIAGAEPGWSKTVGRYGLDYLVMDRVRDGRLIEAVAAAPGLEVVYADEQAIVARVSTEQGKPPDLSATSPGVYPRSGPTTACLPLTR